MSGAREESRGENRTRRVLLVDDDAGFVEGISAYLTECGHAVETVSSGLAALAALGRGRPDVILLDLHLPSIKGVHVLRHIRQADSTIPIFIVTGSPDGALAVEALQNGAAGYVPKPMKLEYLNHLVGVAAQARRGDRTIR
ncbi:MAG: response regulator [Candidatus Rokuibacteriota bacterium]